jgi:UDP-N-acetyl-D-mannosaminuronic acid dehydrogenase
MENTYRDVNIALANEFSHLAERFSVDTWEVIRLANLHPRVNILNPGPGVGGHCISVDPWFLVEAAPDETSLIRTARLVNDSQPQHVVNMIHQHFGEIRDKKIALLGLTYKANVDDLRESPSLVVASLLLKQGAQVSAFDPFIKNTQHFKFHIATTWLEAIQECEAILLLVAHDELLELEPQQVYKHTKARVVVDTVNGWDRKTWQAAGFHFLRLGDGKA